MKMPRPLGIVLLSTTLFAGCLSTKPDANQYSGWMQDYSNLTEFKTPSGAIAMRWLNPALKPGQYKAIMVDTVGYYPAAKPGEQVPKTTLGDIPAYLRNQTRTEIGTVMPVVKQPGPGVLRLRTAITSVETPLEGLKAYEVIPIALVFAGVSAAAGTRDHNPVVYLEVQLIDSETNVVMGKVVRKGFGEPLQNRKAQLALVDVKPLLDSWANDAKVFVSTSVK